MSTTMEEILKEMDESFKVPRKGDTIKGKVVQIDTDKIVLNIGYKNDGIIPRSEVSATNDAAIDEFKIDDEVNAFVLRTDDGDGNVLLSIKRLAQFKDWDELEELYGKEELIKVRIGEVLKGGVAAYYNEVRGFIPASHLAATFVKDMSQFTGQKLEVKIIEINKRRKRIVFSRKDLALAEHKAKMSAVWENVTEGAVVEGEVKRIASFGVFVDVGGFDGLIHLSELSWGRIKSPKDVVAVGDKIQVKVLKADQGSEKISLSIKQLTSDPWTVFNEKYNLEDSFAAKVVNLTDFGAFAELEPGVEGLIHVSQIDKKRIEKPSDALSVGDEVTVKILEADVEEKKLKLSIKATMASEEVTEEA
ncbi:MAG: 30S ribosomal protein S1 [Clostridia bacterium]|nr:30S ribosomal protein S1 [Clostridia bacterium]